MKIKFTINGKELDPDKKEIEVVFEAKPISRFHRLKDIPDYNPEDHVNMGQSAIIQQYINPHLKN
jgi:hypothetical protein